MGPQHEGSWHRTGRVLLPSCQMPARAFHLPLLILSFGASPLTRDASKCCCWPHRRRLAWCKGQGSYHPGNTWIHGASHWHTLYPGSHDSQVMVWKLKNPMKNTECHKRTAFTTRPENMSQPWLPPIQFAAFPACFLLLFSSHSSLLFCSTGHWQACDTLLMDSTENCPWWATLFHKQVQVLEGDPWSVECSGVCQPCLLPCSSWGTNTEIALSILAPQLEA